MTEKVRRRRRKEASTYLLETWGISRTPKTLAKLAVIGGGPPMEYDGRIPLYTDEGMDVWAEAQLSEPVISTAEMKVARDAEGAEPTPSPRPAAAGAAGDSSPHLRTPRDPPFP